VYFYRDRVVGALNRDLPYDQFVIQQIAGDLLRPSPSPSPPVGEGRGEGATQDQIVATDFLRNSMINEEGGIDPEQFRMEAMFDRMDAIGKSILGLTIACARCHDHKYDPVSQRDYYALAGIFRTTDTRFGTSLMAMNGNANAAVTLPRGADVPDALPPLNASQRRQLEQSIAGLGAKMSELAGQGRTASGEYVRTMLKKQTEMARLALFEPTAHRSNWPSARWIDVKGEIPSCSCAAKSIGPARWCLGVCRRA
jgi:hypothetical protein